MNKKSFIKNMMHKCISIYASYVNRRAHNEEIKKSCIANGFNLSPKMNEDAFIKNWLPICKDVDVNYYRYYSHFIGEDKNILPDYILHLIIEPILNKSLSYYFYSDKNMYEKFLDKNVLPNCLLRNIESDYMDADYKILHMSDELFNDMILGNDRIISLKQIIIKPTVESNGGAGVRLFKYINNHWISNDNVVLSLDYLNNEYKKNFIIQECVSCSDFISQFNPTSFNTMRVITYRSVKDDTPHMLGIYLRVGAIGCFKDNVHAGGYAIPIKLNGELEKYAIDGNRKRYSDINNINLSNNTFIVPNFDKIKELVLSIAQNMTTNRLISYDIILDKDNLPKIIEFNIKVQTITTIQTTQSAFFGEFTDEVIDYCKQNLSNISYLKVYNKY